MSSSLSLSPLDSIILQVFTSDSLDKLMLVAIAMNLPLQETSWTVRSHRRPFSMSIHIVPNTGETNEC
jgi:hypothetical protein